MQLTRSKTKFTAAGKTVRAIKSVAEPTNRRERRAARSIARKKI